MSAFFFVSECTFHLTRAENRPPPIEFYLHFSCLLQHYPSLTCSSQTVCLSCDFESEFKFYNQSAHICQDKCAAGYYGDADNSSLSFTLCLPCPMFCDEVVQETHIPPTHTHTQRQLDQTLRPSFHLINLPLLIFVPYLFILD